CFARENWRVSSTGKRDTGAGANHYAESFGKIRRVEGDGTVSALQLHWNGFRGRCIVTLTRRKGDFTVAEHHQQRGAALCYQSNALDCFNQLTGIDSGVNIGFFWEQ